MFLSVIVPVYNTNPQFIQECLDSINILNDLCEYEVIIINDGSTQKETCQFLENLQDNAHYNIINQVNGGLANARNSGIRMANGVYILPLDSDDVLHTDIKYFIEHLKTNSETDVLYGDCLTFGDDNRYFPSMPYSTTQILLFGNIFTATSFFKKTLWEKVGGYDETFKTAEDWEFWCRCAVNGAKFFHLPYTNFQYRKIYNGQSLLQKTQNLIPECHQRILDKFAPTINYQDVYACANYHLLKQIRMKPRKAFYLLIYAYFPKLFDWLYKKKIIRYKDNFIEYNKW